MAAARFLCSEASGEASRAHARSTAGDSLLAKRGVLPEAPPPPPPVSRPRRQIVSVESKSKPNRQHHMCHAGTVRRAPVWYRGATARTE
eukprot:4989939-Pyramimonas_sp.AAC.1